MGEISVFVGSVSLCSESSRGPFLVVHGGSTVYLIMQVWSDRMS